MIGLLLAVEHGNAKKWLLDWSEWEHLGEIATSEQKLRLLVNECAMRLELPGNVCEHTVLPHLDFEDRRHETPLPEHYRVPSMESGDLPCGFEVRPVQHAAIQAFRS